MTNNSTDLKKIIKGMAGKRIIVLGDLMLDEYVFGETERVSREAPVLILKYRSRSVGPGGAANAVANIRALGGIPLPVGVAGSDQWGEDIIRIFKDQGIDTSGIIIDPNVETTVKTRVMAGGMHTIRQQIVRIDREPSHPVDSEVLESKLKSFVSQGADAILVSDYGCGVLSDKIIRFVNKPSNRGNLPMAIDSRYRIHSYRNAALLAPNEEEAGVGSGHGADDLPDIEKKCEKFREKSKSEALLLTRGSEGLSLFTKNSPPEHFPVYGPKIAVDTTGAGDTVVSTAILSVCAGATYSQAAYLANHAGGLTVMKKGASTVSPKELETDLP